MDIFSELIPLGLARYLALSLSLEGKKAGEFMFANSYPSV